MQITHTPGMSANPYVPGPADRRPLHPAPNEVVEIRAGVEGARDTADGDTSGTSIAPGAGGTDGRNSAHGTPPALTYSYPAAGTTDQRVAPQVENGTLTYRIGPFPPGAEVEYRIGEHIRERFTVAQEHAVTGTEEREIGERSASCLLSFDDGSAVRREVSLAAGDDADAKIGALSENGLVRFEAAGGAPEEVEIVLLTHEEWTPRRRLAVRHRRRESQFRGFGERYNAINQLGAALDTRVYEEYKDQYKTTRTYMPVPFFMTDKQWGLYLETDERVRFDLDSASSGTWSYTVPVDDQSPAVRGNLYCGKPASILKSFAQQTGMPAPVPGWVFGPWMSSNEWNSQSRVMQEFNRSKELGIPATVLVIEAWSDEKNFYIWNDARYEPISGDRSFTYDDFTFPADGLWPDPKGMVQALHDEGTRVLLWQIPVLKHMEQEDRQNANDREHMISSRFAIRTTHGEPYRVRPWWFTHGHVLDFGKPDAAEWWMSKRCYLLEELGIDGFKTDGGEHLWGDDVLGHDGVRGDAVANRYPRQYLSAYYSEAARHGGVLFSRAGGPGVQTTPLHWAGDQNSTWEEQRGVLRAVLNAGISGIPLLGWDIGGFSGPLPEPELYIRSTEMACFGTIMQYHSEFNDHRTPHVDRTPWNIAERTGDEAVVDIFRYYANLRMRLIPYLEECARESTLSAAPVMRPLFYSFPDDERSWELDDQYMLGDDLLVAPVLEARRASRSVYLPAGEWIDAWSGEAVSGGRDISTVAPVERLPLYLRKDHSPALDGIFPLQAPPAAGSRS